MEVVQLEALLPRVHEQARKLAALPLTSLIQTKQLIMDPLRPQLRASAKAENAGLAALVGGPANREALAAFHEKRAPDFTGL
jgi:hypothetical protein